MFKKLISENVLCGLDIGSETIKASVIRVREDNSPILLGVFETMTRGFKNASVSDLNELAESIVEAISGLKNNTEFKFKEIQLGICGEFLESRMTSAVIPLSDRGSKVITTQDMRKVQTQARLLGTKMDEVILHAFPQYYRIDDVNTAVNPQDLYGHKLEVLMLLIVVNNTLIKNLTNAVNQAGYDVDNVYFTSYAAAQATLTKEQTHQGCVLIDVGANITELLIFKDGQLKNFYHVFLGGEQITRSIANKLSLSFELADEIKKSYAAALGADSSGDEEILIKRDEGYCPVKKGLIFEAIEPVICELVDELCNHLKESGYSNSIRGGVTMIGGGALLSGFPERLEQNIHLPVCLGRVNIAIRKLHNAAKYSSTAGLAQAGLSRKIESVMNSSVQGNWAKQAVNKVKDFYQEYF